MYVPAANEDLETHDRDTVLASPVILFDIAAWPYRYSPESATTSWASSLEAKFRTSEQSKTDVHILGYPAPTTPD